ncbi:ABC-type phosphate phosphonate transport system, permease component [Lactobacillus selangorensis]|uniref:ABC-type phosphate phosphonate transport system, permease component n=1 Tax=Lactobacillus selangorensis TaxID=81857 RepID=A0A0R2FWB8_9LACO|nr:phosphonate ABC transporter, permease protein PhnE [Lactobacillus selangorensis]KRN28893.1 ABC-type phosphate phosphonate transport system, permease component [Lactobacillus selangorensis]KRN32697.1 ABC-type phosphate phosphonate transport system, permease component [Lactobacillus selangorensis]
MDSKTLTLPKRPFRQRFHVVGLTALLLLLIGLWGSAQITGVNVKMLVDNLNQFVVLLVEMSHPEWAYLSVIWPPIIETIQMAMIGTTIGTLFAIPMALIAAHNIVKNPFIRGCVRLFLDITRSLPDLLLAALFVAVFGIGATAGVVTLAIFSFGMISKLFYEAIETIDAGPFEALNATGANRVQMIAFAVVPQILPAFISYFLYTFEINVRASTVLGYLGAGGIGVYLQRSLSEFDYSDTAVIILATLVVVVAIDGLSTFVRERLA